MRVLVCGGRDYDDAVRVALVLDWLHELFGIDTIIEGGARGADSLASKWAYEHEEMANRGFLADWDRFGKAAGYIRNKQMLVEGQPHVVIAFPGGKGTANMIKQAKEAGVPVGEIKDG